MSDQKRTRTVVVTNRLGLHLRPADAFVKTALRFGSKIEVIKDESERVDGKSVLSLLTLAAVEGTKLSIEACGDDADEALDALADLFARNFDEDDTMDQQAAADTRPAGDESFPPEESPPVRDR